ncbi:MAG: efflux RND transporter periplasmic adaptor subunit [Chloroflexota bacterium]
MPLLTTTALPTPRRRGFRVGRGQLLAVLLVFLACAGIGYAVYPNLTPAAPVPQTTATVQRGSIAASVAASGIVATARQARLSFGSGGKVKSVGVAVGDAVTAGQTLAELDTSALEIKLEQARSSLRTAQTKLQQLRAGSKATDVAAAQAAYESALAKYNDLAAGPAAADVKSAEQAVLSAEASAQKAANDLAALQAGPTPDELIQAKAQVEKAKAALEKAQAEYDKVAWRPDVAMRPEAVALQGATIDYQAALAAYNVKMAPPLAEEITAAEKSAASAQAALASAQERLAVVQAGAKNSELEAARSSLASARASLASKTDGPSPEDLLLQEEQIRQAQLSVRQAEMDQANGKIVAPYNGVIATMTLNVGEQVGGGAAAITIVDPQAVRIDATVDESDVSKVVTGQAAQVTFDSLAGQIFPGKVTAVAPVATVQQGVVSYLVSLQFDTRGRTFPTGLTASVSIITEQKNDVLLVPNRALRTENRQRVVSLQGEGGTVASRPVRVGLSNDQFTEITEGLREGEVVVIPTTTARPAGMGGMAAPVVVKPAAGPQPGGMVVR